MKQKKRAGGRPIGSVVYKDGLGPGGYRNGILQDIADNPGKGPKALANQKENAGEFRNENEKDAYIQAVKITRHELKSIGHDETKPIDVLAAVMDLHETAGLNPHVGPDSPLGIRFKTTPAEAHEIARQRAEWIGTPIVKRGKGRPRKS